MSKNGVHDGLLQIAEAQTQDTVRVVVVVVVGGDPPKEQWANIERLEERVILPRVLTPLPPDAILEVMVVADDVQRNCVLKAGGEAVHEDVEIDVNV